jgi:putative peptidoglycan lipid II flippase
MFYQEYGGLHQAAFLLGALTLASQMLALLRDRLLAHMFGTSATLDVYYAAFRIPDLLFATIASLVSVTVLIPFILDRLEKGESNVQKFLSSVFTAFFIAMLIVSVAVFACIPYLAAKLFPAFAPEQYALLVLMTRILLLSPILLGISNLLQSVTQAFRRFFVYALAPVLYNVGIIVGILVLYPIMGPVGLVWGVIFGAVMHMTIQIPVVMRHHLFPTLFTRIVWEDVKQVVMLSLPRTIGISAIYFSLLVLVIMAGHIGRGAISVFNLSYNLQSVPLAIFSLSYSVAAFPMLARLFSNNEHDKFVEKLTNAARHIFFWSLPVMMLFIVLRAQIVRTILGSGQFTWSDTRLTAAALALFVVSLVAQGIVLLFVRGYYAAGNTRKPLIVNVVSSVGIIALAFGLVSAFSSSEMFRYFVEALLRVEDVGDITVLMLPLAYSCGMLINAGLLVYLFSRDFGGLPLSFTRAFFHSFSGAVFMGFIAYGFLQIFALVFDQNTFWGIFLQGFCAGMLGVIGGIALLSLLGSRELKEITALLHTKFWTSKPIGTEGDHLL